MKLPYQSIELMAQQTNLDYMVCDVICELADYLFRYPESYSRIMSAKNDEIAFSSNDNNIIFHYGDDACIKIQGVNVIVELSYLYTEEGFAFISIDDFYDLLLRIYEDDDFEKIELLPFDVKDRTDYDYLCGLGYFD